ncbi:MAG: hypothetical protein WA708_16650 [Acidobacteriaceae bacterium]
MSIYDEAKIHGLAGEALNYPMPADCIQQSNGLAGDTVGMGQLRPATMREQAEKNVGYHRDQADKQDRAAAFFRENPAFDEFIQLIRSGVIGI